MEMTRTTTIREVKDGDDPTPTPTPTSTPSDSKSDSSPNTCDLTFSLASLRLSGGLQAAQSTIAELHEALKTAIGPVKNAVSVSYSAVCTDGSNTTVNLPIHPPAAE